MTTSNDTETSLQIERRPFDYLHPTCIELRATLGPNWVVARRTSRVVERYGPDVTCVTPQKMRKIEADIIAARGWARPAEKVIADLLAVAEQLIPAIDRVAGPAQTAIANARQVLAKARIP